MMSPLDLLQVGTQFFLAGLVFVVLFKVLTGAINTRGLLVDKASRQFSPVRFQLLIFTMLALGQFLLNADFGQGNDAALPKIDDDLLYALAGSQAIYLTGKGNSVFHLIRSFGFLR